MNSHTVNAAPPLPATSTQHHFSRHPPTFSDYAPSPPETVHSVNHRVHIEPTLPPQPLQFVPTLGRPRRHRTYLRVQLPPLLGTPSPPSPPRRGVKRSANCITHPAHNVDEHSDSERARKRRRSASPLSPLWVPSLLASVLTPLTPPTLPAPPRAPSPSPSWSTQSSTSSTWSSLWQSSDWSSSARSPPRTPSVLSPLGRPAMLVSSAQLSPPSPPSWRSRSPSESESESESEFESESESEFESESESESETETESESESYSWSRSGLGSTSPTPSKRQRLQGGVDERVQTHTLRASGQHDASERAEQQAPYVSRTYLRPVPATQQLFPTHRRYLRRVPIT